MDCGLPDDAGGRFESRSDLNSGTAAFFAIPRYRATGKRWRMSPVHGQASFLRVWKRTALAEVIGQQ
jgi:hypothetical protein